MHIEFAIAFPIYFEPWFALARSVAPCAWPAATMPAFDRIVLSWPAAGVMASGRATHTVSASVALLERRHG